MSKLLRNYVRWGAFTPTDCFPWRHFSSPAGIAHFFVDVTFRCLKSPCAQKSSAAGCRVYVASIPQQQWWDAHSSTHLWTPLKVLRFHMVCHRFCPQALAEALKVNKTVTKIDLGYHQIRNEGAEAWCLARGSVAPGLRMGEIKWNQVVYQWCLRLVRV